MARTTRQSATAFLPLLLAMAALAGGCSSFDNEWNAASAIPASSTDITGRWEGEWKSDQADHSGGLRCVVSRVDEQTYRVHFDATYAGALHFDYVVNLTGEAADDGYTYLEGEADLGMLAGGRYEYRGRVDSTDFHCNYSSSNDRGQFTMSRPEGTGGSDNGQDKDTEE